MNKHQALYKRVMDYAKRHPSIRLVEMNGSRVNPNIQADDYQDFDIVFYIKDYHLFDFGVDQVHQFGDVLIMQTKDDQIPQAEDMDDWYIYLIQFEDGTRLDLTLRDINDYGKPPLDSLSKILIDKDHISHQVDADESTYFVKKPKKIDFSRCVNEFYWVCPYVSKGLIRNQLIYAAKHLHILRNQYEKVLDWWIGDQHAYKITVGKGKSRYKDLLPEDYHQAYNQTYVTLSFDAIYQALMQLMKAYNDIASKLSERLDFPYNHHVCEKIQAFINHQLKK